MIAGLARGAWGFVKGIPWQAWTIAALVVAFWWWGEHREGVGYGRALAEADKVAKKEIVYRDRVTVEVQEKIVEKVRTIREKGDEIVRVVQVPSDACPIDGSYRVLHDAAATSTVPDAAASVDAAPVPVEDAARTVVGNYTDCNVTIERLNGWIDWAEQQCALNKGGCPPTTGAE